MRDCHAAVVRRTAGVGLYRVQLDSACRDGWSRATSSRVYSASVSTNIAGRRCTKNAGSCL